MFTIDSPRARDLMPIPSQHIVDSGKNQGKQSVHWVIYKKISVPTQA